MDYTAEINFWDKGGLFGGLTNHSIILGILSGISTCTLLFLGLTRSCWWYVLMIPCIGSLFFSASRGAIGATLLGVITIMIIAYRVKKVNTKTWLFVIISVFTMIYLGKNTDILSGVRDKNEDRSVGILSSREEKINFRIEEFKSSPIIGIGFSTVSLSGGDEIDTRTGRIEPGSSWLALLSMTGIIGLIFFIIMIIRGLKYQTSKRTTYSMLLLSLLVFFLVSLFSEGYIFAAGSPLCFILWLVLGNCFE